MTLKNRQADFLKILTCAPGKRATSLNPPRKNFFKSIFNRQSLYSGDQIREMVATRFDRFHVESPT
jgi:hypothetical protein